MVIDNPLLAILSLKKTNMGAIRSVILFFSVFIAARTLIDQLRYALIISQQRKANSLDSDQKFYSWET